MSVSDLLPRWLEEEREVFGRVHAGLGPGRLEPALMRSMTGLQVMEAMLRGELPYAEIARTLAFGAIYVAHGVAVFQGAPSDQHTNPMGMIHGGWIATLLDSALGSAVLTALPAGRASATTALDVKYLKALPAKTPRVRAEAKVIRSEARTATAEARLVGPDGAIYASASTACRVFGLPLA